MNKKEVKIVLLLTIVAILLITLTTTVHAKDVKIKRMIIGDHGIIQGPEFFTYVVVENTENQDIDNLKVVVRIPQLDIVAQSRTVDLENNDDQRSLVTIAHIPPYAKNGWYLARISVHGDNVHRVKHRYVYLS